MRCFSFIGRARAGKRFSLHVGGWVDSCVWRRERKYVLIRAETSKYILLHALLSAWLADKSEQTSQLLILPD